MNNSVIQLLVLAGVAVFLILKLRATLGTRDGYEGPTAVPSAMPSKASGPELVEGGPDRDITDHVAAGSTAAQALAAMKLVEPAFSVGGFLQGARGAYEMILEGFAKGDIAALRPFLSPEVAESFEAVIRDRKEKGLNVSTDVQGVRELAMDAAEFNRSTSEAELTVHFVAELITATRDAAGTVIDGDAKRARRQKDVWTFGRTMGANDPNWQLIATGT